MAGAAGRPSELYAACGRGVLRNAAQKHAADALREASRP
jgi:hypothetical protein